MTDKNKTLDVLNEVWDLMYNLEGFADKSHAEAIRKTKPKLERIMYLVDLKDIHILSDES